MHQLNVEIGHCARHGIAVSANDYQDRVGASLEAEPGGTMD